jgi:hypothetical protein
VGSPVGLIGAVTLNSRVQLGLLPAIMVSGMVVELESSEREARIVGWVEVAAISVLTVAVAGPGVGPGRRVCCVSGGCRSFKSCRTQLGLAILCIHKVETCVVEWIIKCPFEAVAK